MAPDNVEVISGLARAFIAAGQVAEARALLDAAPDALSGDPAIARARSALELAGAAQPDVDARGLEKRIAADPDDLEARYELAGALLNPGDRDAPAPPLFDVIRRSRDRNAGPP